MTDTAVLLAAITGSVSIITAVIALFTLIISRATHKVTNSRLSETLDKVDALTIALEQSRALNVVQADTAAAVAAAKN